MPGRTDTLAPDDKEWEIAVHRETVIRQLTQKHELTAEDVGSACEKLGIKKTILYQLIERYRANPRTSSHFPMALP